MEEIRREQFVKTNTLIIIGVKLYAYKKRENETTTKYFIRC